jgi:hypothetical protein
MYKFIHVYVFQYILFATLFRIFLFTTSSCEAVFYVQTTVYVLYTTRTYVFHILKRTRFLSIIPDNKKA